MAETIQVDGKDISIEQFRNDWALALMSQGVIVKLSIKKWGATAKLTPEMLGIKFIDRDVVNFASDYLRLGTQKLFPKDVLLDINSLEKNGRKALFNYSFKTIWGHFVPFTAFNEWKDVNEIIQNNYTEAIKKLGREYDEIVFRVKGDYKNLARDVWARLYPNNSTGVTSSFMESFSNKVISQIPPREEIINCFSYSSTYFMIPMPSFVENNIAKAERIKSESAMLVFENELARTTKQEIADEYKNRKKEFINSFLEHTVSELRHYVAKLCDSVLKSLGQHVINTGEISNQQKKKLTIMIKKVKFLNFYNDTEINELLEGLETGIGRYKGDGNLEVIVDKLEKIVEIGSKEFIPKNFNPSIGYLDAGLE